MRGLSTFPVFGPLFAAILVSWAGVAGACTVPANAAALRGDLLVAVNAERRSAGRPPLVVSDRLEGLAQALACDNARHNRLSHSTADGRNLSARLRAAGYAHGAVNENVAQAPGQAGAAVRLWMQSRQHRDNIRAASTREFGGGVAQARNGGYYWAMISAAPR